MGRESNWRLSMRHAVKINRQVEFEEKLTEFIIAGGAENRKEITSKIPSICPASE